MTNTLSPLLDADHSRFSEIAQRQTKLQAVRAGLASFLEHEGLGAQQALLAVDQVMAGQPSRSPNSASAIGGRPPEAIRVAADDLEAALKVEHALSALSGALDRYVYTTLQIKPDGFGTDLSIVPWSDRAAVERALLQSPFASGPAHPAFGPLPSFSSPTPGQSPPVAKTPAGHPLMALERERFFANLYRTAGLYLRPLNLYADTTFTHADANLWSERLLAGGTVVLPVRNNSEQARPFYEQLAQAMVPDAQGVRGLIAPFSIHWQEGKTLSLVVDTGLPPIA